MKIFAKRKRTNVSAVESPAPAPQPLRDSFASDPVVEELLKKDPKEWNSKERRMIKRYQDRKVESEPTASLPSDQKADHLEENDAHRTQLSGQDGSDHSDKDDDNQDSNNHKSSGSSDGEDNDAKERTSSEVDETADDDASLSKGARNEIAKVVSEHDSGEIDPSHEIFQIMDQLNSKTKRTLTRKLGRSGVSVLDEVVKEAKAALAASTKGPSTDGTKIPPHDLGNDEPCKKKRKKEADLSSLPAEERLRREEQRRKQQEAAERRARGEDKTPGYKHPLNSERRRANKRKPKWTNGTGVKAVTGVANEHHHSGYLHRKQT